MGPLYGSFFAEMGAACADVDRIDAATVGRMLSAGREVVEDLGEARVGDKTLLDTLVPASDAYQAALAGGASFAAALAAMAQAAEQGKESTRDLVARVGRASRLGERSRGVLDAGATSCWLLLTAMADSMQRPAGRRRPERPAAQGRMMVLTTSGSRAVRWKASTASSSGTSRVRMRSMGTEPSSMSMMARSTAARLTPTLAWMVSCFQTTLNSSISMTRPTLPSHTS